MSSFCHGVHANWSMAAPCSTGLDKLNHLNSMSNRAINPDMLEKTHTHVHTPPKTFIKAVFQFEMKDPLGLLHFTPLKNFHKIYFSLKDNKGKIMTCCSSNSPLNSEYTTQRKEREQKSKK